MDTLHLDRRAARRPAGGDLAARVLELGRRFGAVHHRLVGAVAALDDSGLWALDGHSTCAAWIADHLAVAYGTAREWLRVGHALTRLTAIDAAFGCGDLTYAQVRTLTRIAVDHPSREHDLLDLAVRTPARHLAVALAEWCTRHEAPDDLDRRHRRDTALSARIEPDGMGVITLRLPPPEHGQLMAAIDTKVMTSRRTAPGQPTERGGNASADERSTPSVNDNGRGPERPPAAAGPDHRRHARAPGSGCGSSRLRYLPTMAGDERARSAELSVGAVALATAGLKEALRFLDRGLAPRQKARAFLRAVEVVEGLDDDTLTELLDTGRLQELDGIGPSTGGVIADAVAGRPSPYLARLDEESRQQVGPGADLLAALRGDLHSHTTWSDGGASLEEMARAAQRLGHEYLAITDHSPRLTIAHGLNPQRLAEQLDVIQQLNEELAPFRVLTGMEVDILVDGSLDLPEELLARLDVVVASVHSKLRLPEQEMTRRMVLAVSSPHVDVLGHCTGRQVVGTGRAASRFDADLVFAACARFDTAVEVNCRPERQDPPEELLERALEWGCHLSIDTDAHAPGQLEWQPSGCDKVALLGGEDRVINTWDADTLLDWCSSHAA